MCLEIFLSVPLPPLSPVTLPTCQCTKVALSGALKSPSLPACHPTSPTPPSPPPPGALLPFQCTKATNDILPVVFEKLPELLDPKRICEQAGVCRSLVSVA